MQAVRENRYIVLAKDFEKGYKNNIKKDETEHEFYKQLMNTDNLKIDYYGNAIFDIIFPLKYLSVICILITKF